MTFQTTGFSVYAVGYVKEIILEDTVLDAEGNTWRVTATYGPETGLPQNAKLDVKEVEIDTVEGLLKAIDEKRENGRNVAVSRTFDIRILDNNGNECQPLEGTSVQVKFELEETANQNLTTEVYHIQEIEEGYEAQPLEA